MVVYDDVSTEPVRVFDSGVMMDDPRSFGEFQLSYRTGDIISPAVQAAEPLHLEMADFCHSIRTGAAPRSSAVVGAAVEAPVGQPQAPQLGRRDRAACMPGVRQLRRRDARDGVAERRRLEREGGEQDDDHRP